MLATLTPTEALGRIFPARHRRNNRCRQLLGWLYWGCNDLDGREGKLHPFLGARLMGWLFDAGTKLSCLGGGKTQRNARLTRVRSALPRNFTSSCEAENSGQDSNSAGRGVRLAKPIPRCTHNVNALWQSRSFLIHSSTSRDAPRLPELWRNSLGIPA